MRFGERRVFFFFFRYQLFLSFASTSRGSLSLVVVREDVLADLLVHREHRDRRREDGLELPFD